ncbi:MAG TPA: hypothetical protein VHD32_07020 [Candidatus Didemnitutus sp.]|nr:hypothetical protein [Candidatus Didemnitutus sp.]
MRRDVEKAIEPKAQALLETSAEVLGGLINAFDEYKTRRNREWEREDASARKAAPKRTAGRRGPRKRAA